MFACNFKTTIAECTQGKPLVMFIIDGIVQVIERLLVYERPLKHQHDKQIYQLYHFQETLQTLPPNVKPVFMNTVTLTSGACVGFGKSVEICLFHCLLEKNKIKLKCLLAA